MSKEEVIKMAVDAVHLIRQLAAEMPETEIVLEYSPELFWPPSSNSPGKYAMQSPLPGAPPRNAR